MEMNNKYLVFLGDVFYPLGGWKDFLGYFESLEMALQYILSQEPSFKWAHIVHQGKLICSAEDETKDNVKYKWIFKEVENEMD